MLYYKLTFIELTLCARLYAKCFTYSPHNNSIEYQVDMESITRGDRLSQDPLPPSHLLDPCSPLLFQTVIALYQLFKRFPSPCFPGSVLYLPCMFCTAIKDPLNFTTDHVTPLLTCLHRSLLTIILKLTGRTYSTSLFTVSAPCLPPCPQLTPLLPPPAPEWNTYCPLPGSRCGYC